MPTIRPTGFQTWNRYAYVINNPLSYIDPYGLQLMGPVQCSTNGPNTCPGGGIDSSALDPMGGGGLWGGALGGGLIPIDVYGWIPIPEDPSDMYLPATPGVTYLSYWGVVGYDYIDFGGLGQTGNPGTGPVGGGANGPNPRLLNIAQQIQTCPQFSNVGNQIAQGVYSGTISVGNVPSNAVGTTNGYFNPTSVIAPDALDDPSTVIHEWIHQTQAAGNPFFIFLKGANQIQSLFTSDSQGFLDYSAQAVANKIVSVCGVK